VLPDLRERRRHPFVDRPQAGIMSESPLGVPIPARSAVQCGVDQENEAGDPEQHRDQGREDQHGHRCATNGMSPHPPGHLEPHDEQDQITRTPRTGSVTSRRTWRRRRSTTRTCGSRSTTRSTGRGSASSRRSALRRARGPHHGEQPAGRPAQGLRPLPVTERSR